VTPLLDLTWFTNLDIFPGETPTVRPLSTKSSQSKGCAFIEFISTSALQSALKLHHTQLGGRKINVELTVGGGSNGPNRLAKIEGLRSRLDEERQGFRDKKLEKAKVDKVKGAEQVELTRVKARAEGVVKVSKRQWMKKPQLSGANETRLG